MDMTTIIERYRASFNQQYGARATQQINRAIGAVVDCHTERYGKMQCFTALPVTTSNHTSMPVVIAVATVANITIRSNG